VDRWLDSLYKLGNWVPRSVVVVYFDSCHLRDVRNNKDTPIFRCHLQHFNYLRQIHCGSETHSLKRRLCRNIHSHKWVSPADNSIPEFRSRQELIHNHYLGPKQSGAVWKFMAKLTSLVVDKSRISVVRWIKSSTCYLICVPMYLWRLIGDPAPGWSLAH